MRLRVGLFLAWLLLVALVPVGAALMPDSPPWVPYLPWASAVVALASVAIVVPPRGFSPLAWLLDVAAVAAAALPPRRLTSSPSNPPKEP